MKLLPIALYMSAALVAGSAFAEKVHHDEWSEESQFKKMDADGDGKITASEHESGAKSMFTKMDANADGKVTSAEMDAAHAGMAHGGMKAKGEHAGRHMTSAEKIAVIDKNKDGAISADEHAKGSKEMFGKMDTDRSGDLTQQEARDGHKKMMTASEGD